MSNKTKYYLEYYIDDSGNIIIEIPNGQVQFRMSSYTEGTSGTSGLFTINTDGEARARDFRLDGSKT